MKLLKNPLVKISVSVLLFTFVFMQMDLSDVVANFRKLNLWYVPLIFFLLVMNYLISSIRWKKLLIFENTSYVTVKYLTSLYFVGAFFNNFMPTSIGGDVYKALKLGTKINSKTNAISATFMERFTGVLTLVLISNFGLIKTFDFWLKIFPDFINENVFFAALLKFFVFSGFWIAGVCGFSVLRFFANKSAKIKGFYAALFLYRGKNDVLIVAFVTSFIVQMIAIFTQYFIFVALGITNLSLVYSLLFFPIITLASFFVPSLNGIGVQDALYIQLFSIVGIPVEIALAASILYHLFRLFTSLIGGIIYAFGKDY